MFTTIAVLAVVLLGGYFALDPEGVCEHCGHLPKNHWLGWPHRFLNYCAALKIRCSKCEKREIRLHM